MYKYHNMALRAFHNNPCIGGFGNESNLLIKKTSSSSSRKYNVATHMTTTAAVTTTTGMKSSSSSSSTGTSSTHKKETESYHDSSSFSSSYRNNGGDAFAQIVKELVDNAIDACRINTTNQHACSSMCSQHSHFASNNNTKNLKRVRVSIERVDLGETNGTNNNHNDTDEEDRPSTEEYNKMKPTNNDESNEVLRVTVTDNGCGMENIEHCVSIFSTTKSGHPTTRTTTLLHQEEDSSKSSTTAGVTYIPSKSTHAHTTTTSSRNNTMECKSNGSTHHTTGRYGLGLTLCLLHAQRLVPDSCASITSSTSEQSQWTVAKFVVDAERDTVVCVDKQFKNKKTKKKRIQQRSSHDNIHSDYDNDDGCGGNNESGTAVSLLVPVSIFYTALFFKILSFGGNGIYLQT